MYSVLGGRAGGVHHVLDSSTTEANHDEASTPDGRTTNYAWCIRSSFSVRLGAS